MRADIPAFNNLAEGILGNHIERAEFMVIEEGSFPLEFVGFPGQFFVFLIELFFPDIEFFFPGIELLEVLFEFFFFGETEFFPFFELLGLFGESGFKLFEFFVLKGKLVLDTQQSGFAKVQLRSSFIQHFFKLLMVL